MYNFINIYHHHTIKYTKIYVNIGRLLIKSNIKFTWNEGHKLYCKQFCKCTAKLESHISTYQEELRPFCSVKTINHNQLIMF